ncbi:MAG: hypothetical protein GTO55_04025 [Armatimonadetes bacterium]|nr:hypothetical protein [Armatimonadota bacterium]NIM23440.1 hypothetical protein [Armatimonadota bacterium]NIM67305.1 hypothetical protein [Armatimonadota bacterium]NIM75803.1 hypothetical protein [Armatimonadota bacterium]NIN05491.1 hypothetical protein [Armatimonadota bacterium]
MTTQRVAWLTTMLLLVVCALGLQYAEGAQSEAKYMGPKMCIACHKATHADIIAASSKTAHSNAMWKIGDEGDGRRIVADFSKEAPFSREEVAYVLGTGRKYQSFLDKDLNLLPGEWIVKDKAWRARESVDAAKDCVGCHTTGFDPAARKWAALGVTCEMCHGPGSVHMSAKDKKASIVRPQELDPQERAMICGQCHAVGKSKDGTYTFPHSYRPGEDLGQFFTLATEILKEAVNSQYNEFVHGGGKHLAAGTTCSTCHNPHGSTEGVQAQLRQPVNQLCLQEGCHGGKLAGSQHSEKTLKMMSCTICHLPGGKHTFKAPKK